MAIVKTSTVSLSISQRMAAGLICVFLGATMVFMVGLSHINTRHSLSFPCH
jgi:cobalt transporter subunit CbtB